MTTRSKVRRLILVLVLGTIALLPGTADVFSSPKALYQIKTDHFTFIFSEETRQSAEHLAVRAEAMYAWIAGLLDQPMNLHIPVVITPDTDQLNGYFTAMPSNRIVLYQAPLLPNAGFATYNHTLEKLFLHELTHAVSMNIRAPIYRFLSWIVGDIILPAGLTASQNFIEGVTVSFESLDGFGRANGTAYAQVIQQDILEDRFMTFNETSGIRRNYPGGSWYIYGGWFSRYLQETYGMESYAELWKEFGALRGIWDSLLFPGAFRRVYRQPLTDVWEDFRRWMSLKIPVVAQTLPVTQDWDSIQAITARGDKVYYAGSEGIYLLQLSTGERTRLAPADQSVNRLSLSPDGQRLLISSFRPSEPGLARAQLRIFNLAARRFESTELPRGLTEAAFTPEGILALRIQGYSTDLVHLDHQGRETTLYRGSLTSIPSHPGIYQPGYIHFLLQQGGVKAIARLHRETGEVEILQSSIPLGEIRTLSITDQGITFAWDNNLTMFKAGRLGPRGLELQTTPISGAIAYPVLTEDSLVYAGSFSMGERIMEYPLENPAMAPSPADHTWIALDSWSAPHRTTSSLGRPADTFQPLDFSPEQGAEQKPALESKPYYPITRVLLPQQRIPTLVLDPMAEELKDLVQGAGIITMSSDPTERLYLDWYASYLWNWRFVDAGIAIRETSLPVDFLGSVTDSFAFPTPLLSRAYRTLRASLGVGDQISFSPAQRRLSWQVDSGVIFQSSGPQSDMGVTSPYQWDLGGPVVPLNAQVGYSELYGGIFPPYEQRGIYSQLSWHGLIRGVETSPELPNFAALKAGFTLPFLGLSLDAAGFLSLQEDVGFLPYGAILNNQLFPGSIHQPQYFAYGSYQETSSPYYVSAQASSTIRFDIGKSLPGQFYLQKGSLGGGYRMAFLNGDYLDSLYLQAALTFHWSQGTIEVLPLRLGIEAEYTLREPAGQGWQIRLLSVLDIAGLL